MTVKKIYSRLRSDLNKCIEFLEIDRPEYVKMYFGTDKRSEIEQKLSVICKTFSEYQLSEIEKIKTELHSYFISKPTES
jgi:hypothetical protein